MRRTRITRRRGFTLIELLLVAGILAVLAAFAVPSLLGQARKAQNKIAEAQIGRNGPIARALENYKFDMGKYPDTDEGLQVLFLPKDRVEDPRYSGPYLEGSFEQLRDPWTNPYNYRAPGEFNETGFDLWCNGVDGKDDGGKEGSDDLKNWIER